ncbi:hypothetical protein BES34_001465 [Leptospira inadai serovar Lyme]|uniref:Uncharacterized protein n=1 Tax=Leptospira inadai serovar Lyme TaxID=293084 RepID=A0ABX4YP82_9LEPT|nr:hypothetical protein BES34_001465 [Leptospira inadai serovar Lyme]
MGIYDILIRILMIGRDEIEFRESNPRLPFRNFIIGSVYRSESLLRLSRVRSKGLDRNGKGTKPIFC